MVHLNKIYTRTGDGGRTSLGDGTRVDKTDLRIESYGTVDELNAHVGRCTDGASGTERDQLLRIQHELFDLGADLCVPVRQDDDRQRLRLGDGAVARLERWIDEANAGLPELTSFVLPGGGERAIAYHLARTVCRRAERRVLSLAAAEGDRVNPAAAIYLNRLSDLLFVLGRAAAGDDERLWEPGHSGAD